MLLVLNDIAFTFGFPDKYTMINKMKELIELIMELKKNDPRLKLSTCHRIKNCELTSGYYLSQLFHEPPDVFPLKYQTAIKTLLLSTNKIDEGKGEIEYKGVRSKQCAYAFEMSGFVLSIQSQTGFLNEYLMCRYFADEITQKNVELKNLSTMDHIKIHRYAIPIRKYDPNPKHKRGGGRASIMDLTDEVAQKVLNCSVEADNNSKHLIAKYNGKYYSFRSHWDVYYHGYRDDTMPEKLKNKVDAEMVQDKADGLRRHHSGQV